MRNACRALNKIYADPLQQLEPHLLFAQIPAKTVIRRRENGSAEGLEAAGPMQSRRLT
jgi:hypothetical protein